MEDMACILGCGGVRKKRGLCNKHYVKALALVNAGKTTWAREELHGRAVPPSKVWIGQRVLPYRD